MIAKVINKDTHQFTHTCIYTHPHDLNDTHVTYSVKLSFRRCGSVFIDMK